MLLLKALLSLLAEPVMSIDRAYGIMPNFFLLLPLEALILVGLILARKRHRKLFVFVLPALVLILLLEGFGLLGYFHVYRFEVTEKAGTIVMVREGRNRGTWGADLAPEVLVGGMLSPWLKSIDTWGGKDYDEWRYEEREPAKLQWEGRNRCWIERWPGGASGTGFFVEPDAHGQWHLLYKHGRPESDNSSRVP